MENKTEVTYNENNGYFYVEVDGNKEAKMTFVFGDDDTMTINHTEVDPGFNGKGFGKKMFDKAVAFAREKGLKIVPLCPFVKSIFDKTSEFNDVLK